MWVSLNVVLEAIFGLLWCKDPKAKLSPETTVEELCCAPTRQSGYLLDLIRQVSSSTHDMALLTGWTLFL